MTTNTITQLPDPQGFAPDPLTELLRSGAQRLIEQAVEAELAVLLDAYASDKTDDAARGLCAMVTCQNAKCSRGSGRCQSRCPV